MAETAAARSFDPNSAAAGDSGIFGLHNAEPDSAVVYLPVPWEATTSYGGGTAGAPSAILKASRQVDLYDGDVLRPYEAGLCLLDESADVRGWNREARADAEKIIAVGGDRKDSKSLGDALERVNAAGERLNEFVRIECLRRMEAGKIVGVIGGDHAVPFGALQAAAQIHGEYGVLHFDAHHDLRAAYEGFTWSHASIMRNALDQIRHIETLVQVGIRDYCEEELDYCTAQVDRVRAYYDRMVSRRLFGGESWSNIAREIVEHLPEKVWVSLDIDGLDPRFCPHTGTPVPGGLDFNQTNFLLGEVARSGRHIIGFDLCEVAPAPDGKNEWDANVGARLLYKLSGWALASQGKTQVQP
ncbi:MAG: agmatinase family protein [Elusimicrobiota bacterium]